MTCANHETRIWLLAFTLLIAGGCAAGRDATEQRLVTPPARVAVQSDIKAARDAEHRCLALAMYWEARGEGVVGMQAVGEVVLNRVADHRFPASACAVVKQGGERPPCQFSWWCDGRSDYPADRALWREALQVADSLSSQRSRRMTAGALFFHNTSVRPNWKYQRVATIGNHVFYK
ncbi:MAG: cell wall hydrolase [Pseudomonadaceae bacterium]|nr:cell wall hydrolase [Pseudomonadaceae bacterium]